MKVNFRKLWVVGILFFVIAGGVGWWVGEQRWGLRETRERMVQTVLGEVTFEVNNHTPGQEYYRKMKQGCPVRDCIPSLKKPRFESLADANQWLQDDDMVLGIDIDGVARAYPQRILNWHEILNEELRMDNGELKPILVTFSPLTGSAAVFERRVKFGSKEKVLTFGVSGKVYNSNTVMYDKETESLWQQIGGQAVVGEYTGNRLTQLPMDVTTWKAWKTAYPQTEVLSLSTGYVRAYDQHPYGTYEADSTLYYPVEGALDQATLPKTVVYGVVVGEIADAKVAAKAYTLDALIRETQDDGVLLDTVGGVKVRLSYNGSKVLVENLQTKKTLMATRMYWFAWKAFYTKSELYQ